VSFSPSFELIACCAFMTLSGGALILVDLRAETLSIFGFLDLKIMASFAVYKLESWLCF